MIIFLYHSQNETIHHFYSVE